MTRKKAIMMVGSSLFLLVFLATTASAQKSPIDKGSINIGGMFSFDSYGGDWYGDGYTQIILVPSFRYFIIRGLAVGGDLMVNKVSEEGWSDTLLGIGPAVAYMFKTNSDKFYPYVGAKIMFFSDSWGNGESNSGSAIDFGFGGGLAYMLAKNVAVTAELNYHIQRWSFEGDSWGGHLLSLSVGLAVFLY